MTLWSQPIFGALLLIQVTIIPFLPGFDSIRQRRDQIGANPFRISRKARNKTIGSTSWGPNTSYCQIRLQLVAIESWHGKSQRLTSGRKLCDAPSVGIKGLQQSNSRLCGLDLTVYWPQISYPPCFYCRSDLSL